MKIPFERTIVGAYRFAFTNILSIIGIGWLPFLLLGLVAVALVYSLLPLLTALSNLDPNRIDAAEVMRLVAPMVGAILILVVVAVFAKAMVIVGVIRKALGQHPAPVFVFFSLGAQVWRMIGAYLLLVLLVWGVGLAFGFGIAGISFLLSKISAALQGLVTTLLICGAAIWGIYAVVRVQYFLPAVVVAENHIGIRRSWHLGRGNFWRIVGIVILMTLPATIVLSTINSVIFQLVHLPQLMWTPDRANPHIPLDEMHRYSSALFATLRNVWPYLVVTELLYVTVLTGLQAGAVANAYNLVTVAGDTAPPTDASKAAA